MVWRQAPDLDRQLHCIGAYQATMRDLGSGCQAAAPHGAKGLSATFWVGEGGRIGERLYRGAALPEREPSGRFDQQSGDGRPVCHTLNCLSRIERSEIGVR